MSRHSTIFGVARSIDLTALLTGKPTPNPPSVVPVKRDWRDGREIRGLDTRIGEIGDGVLSHVFHRWMCVGCIYIYVLALPETWRGDDGEGGRRAFVKSK